MKAFDATLEYRKQVSNCYQASSCLDHSPITTYLPTSRLPTFFFLHLSTRKLAVNQLHIYLGRRHLLSLHELKSGFNVLPYPCVALSSAKMMSNLSSRAEELKSQGAAMAARDPNNKATAEDAEAIITDESKKAGIPAFQFNPNASPEEKAAQARSVS